MRPSLSAALFALALLPVATAQPTPAERADRTARLDSVFHALHADGLFSGAFAIGGPDGEVAYEIAVGESEGETVRLDAPYYLASVSKAMNAAAALALAAEGELDLDAPVGQYLSPWPYDGVTVRHLMNQTAGLHWLGMLTEHRDTTRALDSAGLLALVDARRPPAMNAPGEAFMYSNSHFAALALVLESVTGQPYGEVLRERVFEPAGMESARVGPSGEAEWMAYAGGDGIGVHASVRDLLAFDRAFWSGRIVPEDLVQAATEPPTLADGSASRYVFGRFVETDPRPLIGHFGEGTETKTALYRQRDGAATYAMIATEQGVHRTPVLVAAMSIWNGEPFTLPQPRPLADVPDEVLRRHVGIYASGMGRLHITLEEDGLHLEPEGAGGSEPLIPASETVFYFGGQDLTWEFVQDDAGRTTGLMLQGQPQTLAPREEQNE
jgi:CubicO group peptidase (beta-lactamase class C family)